jgi:hypothetical protein
MNARDKQDLLGEISSGPAGRVNTRFTGRKSLDGLVEGDSLRRPESHFADAPDVGRPCASRRSVSAGAGKTPHSARKPVLANCANCSDVYGSTPLTHPLIVITGDDSAALTAAVQAIRKYRDPLDLTILASMLIHPGAIDNPKQPGGGGMIPPAQTMVFGRPDCASNLRIRVVPISRT